MQTITTSGEQIIKEKRNISKYAGLLCGRILLLAGLFLLILPLSPNPVTIYLFTFFLLIPWLLTIVLKNRKDADPILLNSCAKKFHYSSIQFSVEQNVGRTAVFLLAVWQFYMPNSIAIYLHIAPAILLLLYLLCRMISTVIIHHYIHSYYMELHSLD